MLGYLWFQEPKILQNNPANTKKQFLFLIGKFIVMLGYFLISENNQIWTVTIKLPFEQVFLMFRDFLET